MNRNEAAEYTLNALKKAGADMASVIASDGYTEELNADAGEFSLYRTLFNSSLNIKAIKDGKKGVSDINQFDKEAIEEAVASCMASLENGVPDEAEGIAEASENKRFESGILTPDKELLYDRVQEYMTELKEKYPKINLTQFITKYTRKDTLLINTNGVKFEHDKGYYDYSSTFSAQDGEKVTSMNGYGVIFTDVNTKFLDMGAGRSLLEEALISLDPLPIEGKFVGPIILTPNCLIDMMYYMLSLFIGERALIEGTSIWKDKLGTLVTHPSLTISTKPLDSRIVCNERFTADGYESFDMDIIKDGILNSFLLSRYGAKKTGNPRALNQSMNFIVAAGDKGLSEIIASIERGLVVNRFSGGNPAPNGDFSGVAKNSFSIANGKVAEAVCETMISGNLATLFANIIGISKETINDGMTILPWVALDGVTISGKAVD